MIRVLIVEDESYIRKGLLALLESLTFDIVVVGECESVNEAVIVAKSSKPDLIFMDVNIVGGTGFDVIKQTKELNYKVIFITAYEEFALKALKNGAIDYLLKPIDSEELTIAINKTIVSDVTHEQLEIAFNHFEGEKEKLVLRLQDGYQVIHFNELKYCKSDGGYTHFYLSDGRSFLASKSIKEFESQLPSKMFSRTHQSFIVNLNFIDKYNKRGFVSLKGGGKVEVSMRKKDTFIAQLLK